MACIPADPDISGIGVRVAIYAQNLLSFVPTIWALRDRNVSPYELESVEDQSITILITAFAILISAMVEARTVGLSSFHANIVLNLSWMNNTNTFIYFILYVQNKSQHGRDRIDMNWSSWIRHVVERMSTSLPKSGSADSETQIQILSVEQIRKGLWWSSNKRIRAMFRRIVLVLGSLHLSIMASLGIWLWGNPRLFGSKNTCAQATTVIVGQPVPLTSDTLRIWSIVIYSFFLAPGLNLVPPMVLFLGLFLLYQRWHRGRDAQSHSKHISPGIAPTVLGLALLLILNLVFLLDIEPTLRENRGRQATGESTWTFGQILAMLLLVLPLRDLLETLSERRETKRKKELTKTLKSYIRNYTQKQAEIKEILDLAEEGADINTVVDDSECEYATALQVASSRPDEAFLTALLNYGADPSKSAGKWHSALNVAVVSGHIANVKCLLANGANPNAGGSVYPTAFHAAFNADPLKWDMVKLILLQNHDGKTSAFVGEEYGKALQAAALAGEVEIVKLLVQNGADVDFQDREDATTTLQAGALSGKREIIQLLLDNGAKVNAQGGKYGTALQAAAYNGNSDIVKLLVASNAADSRGGEYGTALQAAALSENPDIVSLLLNSEAGVEVNAECGKYHTALQAAALVGNFDIFLLLVDHGAVDRAGGECGSALQAAAWTGKLKMVLQLLEHGSDINCQGGKYGTALQAAALRGNLAIVRLLLDKEASVNYQGGQYGTALQAAAFTGNKEIVQLLLRSGAAVNAQCERCASKHKSHRCKGGQYGTALQAASYKGHMDIVQLLLDNEADVEIQGGKHGTAVEAALQGGHGSIANKLLERVNLDGQMLKLCSLGGHLKTVALILQMGIGSESDHGMALVAAAFGAQIEVAELLLQIGANVDGAGPGYDIPSPLQIACYGGWMDLARLFLDWDADVNAQGGNFPTALQAALFGGHVTLAERLIGRKADVNARGGRVFPTAFESAVYGGHKKLVISLLERDVDVTRGSGRFDPMLVVGICKGDPDLRQLFDGVNAQVAIPEASLTKRFYRRKYWQNIPDDPELWHLPLHSPHTTQSILVGPCRTGAGGWGSLTSGPGGPGKPGPPAIFRNIRIPIPGIRSEYDMDMDQLLLANNAEVEIQGGAHGTAIEAVLQGGRRSIAKKLLENVNLDGQMLQLCSLGGHLKTVALILQMGIGSESDHGMALVAAAFGAQIEVAELLLQNGANVDGAGPGHNIPSPLQVACYSGWTDLAHLFLDRNADVNAQGGNFPTPLQAAIFGGHVTLADRLLGRKADVNARGGLVFPTAFESAVYGGHKNIVISLLDRGVDVTRGSDYFDPDLVPAICKIDLELRQRLDSMNASITVPEGHALSAFYSAFHSGNDHPIPIPDDPELWAFPLRASPHDEAIGFIKCYRTGRGGKGIWSAPGGPGGHCTPGLVTIQPGVTMLEEDGVDLEDSHTEDGLESEAEPAGGELEDSYTEDGVEPEEETAERDNEGGESETRTEPSEDARE